MCKVQVRPHLTSREASENSVINYYRAEVKAIKFSGLKQGIGETDFAVQLLQTRINYALADAQKDSFLENCNSRRIDLHWEYDWLCIIWFRFEIKFFNDAENVKWKRKKFE